MRKVLFRYVVKFLLYISHYMYLGIVTFYLHTLFFLRYMCVCVCVCVVRFLLYISNYMYLDLVTFYLHTYIYIYMCVCVCVCVYDDDDNVCFSPLSHMEGLLLFMFPNYIL